MGGSRVPGSGDGWVHCALGHRHWGRAGAAGLLVGAAGRSLLQHRAPWTHEGDTWGVPGGARDLGEHAVSAALREAGEEAGLDPDDVRPLGWTVVDHGGWSYTTAVGDVADGRPVPHLRAANAESVEIRWWPDTDVPALPLHPGLRAAWPALQQRPAPLSVVVDVANVVGSRPDGWWHDRAGAAARLWGELTAAVAAGVPAPELPDGLVAGGLGTLVPQVHLVLEGRFRDARAPEAAPGAPRWAGALVVAVAAAGSGDDVVVDTAAARRAAGDQVLVVTADRELRRRVAAAAPAAVTTGPQWLHRRLRTAS